MGYVRELAGSRFSVENNEITLEVSRCSASPCCCPKGMFERCHFIEMCFSKGQKLNLHCTLGGGPIDKHQKIVI
jgi:hypothetical protein